MQHRKQEPKSEQEAATCAVTKKRASRATALYATGWRHRGVASPSPWRHRHRHRGPTEALQPSAAHPMGGLGPAMASLTLPRLVLSLATLSNCAAVTFVSISLLMS